MTASVTSLAGSRLPNTVGSPAGRNMFDIEYISLSHGYGAYVRSFIR